MPNHMKALDWAIEVMYDEFYDKLQWYDNVLDLWWYIGESAIRLAQMNKNVVVYEAHPENYNYLNQNIVQYSNITSHNVAVVWTDKQYMTFYGWAFNMWAGKETTWNDRVKSTTVSCIPILDVLREGSFDAMKMDIEWSEYECMDSIIKSGKDVFTKLKAGFIEFHFYENNLYVKQAEHIIHWIIWLWYIVKYFDPLTNKSIQKDKIQNYNVVFIYFTR